MQDALHYLHHLIFKENDMKTFELTQEQINQLAEKKHAKKLLQQFIPEAFKTELEVVRWYRLKDNPEILALYDCFKHHRPYAYIFNANGNYEYRVEFSLFELPTYWELATEEEVREALINEAKKRGYKEGVRCKFGLIKEIRTIETNDFEFKLEYNTLGIKRKNGNADIIFRSGKWAEIIEQSELTKEEINRVLTFLKNQNEQ